MTLDASGAAASLFAAAKKSGRAWIGDRLVWCAWHDGAIVLVTGGGEQVLPDLSGDVTLADSTGAAALRLSATATALEPGSPAWASAATVLAERRLNGAGQPAELVRRWATESTIVALSVTDGELL